MPKRKKSNGSKASDILDDLVDMNKKTKTKKGRTKLFVQLIVYSIIWVGLIVSLFYQNVINSKINKTDFNFDNAIASSDYKVHFIDVGQGDCALVQFPDGKNMMIDTGESSSKNNLLRYLDSLEIKQIDYLFLTHPDSDHIGNAVTIFEMYDVVKVYLPPIYSNYDVENGLVDSSKNYVVKKTASWSNVVKAAYKEKETTLKDMIYNEMDDKIVGVDNESLETPNVIYEVYIYPPALSELGSSDWNAYSPFVLIKIGGTKFMFTGDADKSDEEKFLDSHSSEVGSNFFDCSVMKVGHHGANTSTGEALLSAVKPEYAIISCGKGNKYNHPRPETLEMIKNNSSAEIMRTDLIGSIVFGTGGTEIKTQSNYNHVNDLYYEWKYFVICGGVVIAIGFVLVIRADKKAKEKENRKKKVTIK